MREPRRGATKKPAPLYETRARRFCRRIKAPGRGKDQFSSSPGSKVSGTVDWALATGVGAEMVEGTFTPSRL